MARLAVVLVFLSACGGAAPSTSHDAFIAQGALPIPLVRQILLGHGI
jgi:hypothetical protein